jgi:ribosomal protein S18 acetylase RimI-like enzyme
MAGRFEARTSSHSVSTSRLISSCRGFGRQLLQHLIDELIKRDVLTLWLEVRASNLPI